MKNRPAYAIESVDNALQLLLILRRDGELRVSTSAAELGVARSTAHRLLAMLRYRGFVVQDANHAYRPGPAFSDLGHGADTAALPALVRPHLQWLSKATGETVNLMIRVGAEIRFIDSIEGRHALRIGDRTGLVVSAELTSGGKALLAELPRSEIERLYPQWPAGSRELQHLLRQLTATRANGYGANAEESEPGVLAIGMVIRGADETAVAAMTVAAPTVRVRRSQVGLLAEPLRQACERVRADLIELRTTANLT